MDEQYLAALQAERSICARRGLKDRVAAIDAEIKRVGGQVVETAAVDAPETAARPRPVRKAAR